jgi:urocanate hydratase
LTFQLSALSYKLALKVPSRTAQLSSPALPYMKLHQNGTVSYLDQTGCFLAGGRARVKLQIDEGMWNGFDFYYFYLDRINRIIRSFFACGEGPFGRRPHDPNDPVDPVQLFSLK